MKKNTNSPIKKEQGAKRARAQRPVRRETKAVLAELVEKLRGKLTTSASQPEGGPRGELSPNLDRLTVGVDLGDQWSHFCILGLEGETVSEEQLQTTPRLQERSRRHRGEVIVGGPGEVLERGREVNTDLSIWDSCALACEEAT